MRCADVLVRMQLQRVGTSASAEVHLQIHVYLCVYAFVCHRGAEQISPQGWHVHSVPKASKRTSKPRGAMIWAAVKESATNLILWSPFSGA